MNYFLSLFFINVLFLSTTVSDKSQVLQSILNIEEFQNYLNTSPRFVGTSNNQEVYLVSHVELDNKNDLHLKIRDRSVRILSELEVNELDHNFYIRIDEFEIEKSRANVLISYQNAKLLYEKNKVISLYAQLNKTESNEWIVDSYTLKEVSSNTSY